MRWLAFAIMGASALAGCSSGEKPADPAMTPQIARGQAYYTTCQGCHGNAGEGLPGMKAPRLAGLPADYISAQLMLYRKGVRGGPDDFQGVQMNGRAKALPSDEAVRDVAAYIATLPLPAPAPVLPAAARAGADFYTGCAACHGEKGEGNAALHAPPLAGTSPDYLARQLRNFRKGIRGREGDATGQIMKVAAQSLPNDAAIDAVAACASAVGAGACR